MNEERKKHIDSLWMNTQFGKWVFAAAKGKGKEAEQIASELFKEYPFFLSEAEHLLSEELQKELKQGEFIEYLKLLEKEDYELVDFIISHEILEKLY